MRSPLWVACCLVACQQAPGGGCPCPPGSAAASSSPPPAPLTRSPIEWTLEVTGQAPTPPRAVSEQEGHLTIPGSPWTCRYSRREDTTFAPSISEHLDLECNWDEALIRVPMSCTYDRVRLPDPNDMGQPHVIGLARQGDRRNPVVIIHCKDTRKGSQLTR